MISVVNFLITRLVPEIVKDKDARVGRLHE